MPDQERQPEDLRIPLHVEAVSVSRREVEKANVRIALITGTREQLVDEELTHVRVEIERVPIRRPLEVVGEPARTVASHLQAGARRSVDRAAVGVADGLLERLEAAAEWLAAGRDRAAAAPLRRADRAGRLLRRPGDHRSDRAGSGAPAHPPDRGLALPRLGRASGGPASRLVPQPSRYARARIRRRPPLGGAAGSRAARAPRRDRARGRAVCAAPFRVHLPAGAMKPALAGAFGASRPAPSPARGRSGCRAAVTPSPRARPRGPDRRKPNRR